MQTFLVFVVYDFVFATNRMNCSIKETREKWSKTLGKTSYTSCIVIFHFSFIVSCFSVLHTISIQIQCILSNKPNIMTLYESIGCSCGKLENTKKICITVIGNSGNNTKYHPLSTHSHKALSHRRLHLIECHILIHHTLN